MLAASSPLFGWLSLRSGAFNKGNTIIDDATWRLLDRPRRQEFSSFHPLPAEQLADINALAALILPGATLLDNVEHPIAASLERVRCPKLAIGVAFCTQRPDDCSLEIAAAIRQPIGSRDPFTHAVLRNAGIASHFVGCSTLHTGVAQAWVHRDGPVVFSLGRGEQLQLRQCVAEIARHHDVIVLQHVPELQPPFDCSSPVRWIDLKSGDQLRQIYGDASVVVTGRLHGALPALAMGVPVFFFGVYRDSRFSLIDYLKIEQLPPEPEQILRRIGAIRSLGMGDVEPLDRAAILRTNMRLFLDRYWSKVSGPSVGNGSSEVPAHDLARS